MARLSHRGTNKTEPHAPALGARVLPRLPSETPHLSSRGVALIHGVWIGWQGHALFLEFVATAARGVRVVLCISTGAPLHPKPQPSIREP